MVTPRTLIQGTQLPAAVAILYTAPDSTRAKIIIMTVTNTTGTARTVTVHLVAPGDVASADNKIISAKTVAPGQDLILASCAQVLESGGTIQAFASAAAALSLMASGAEIT